MRYNEEEKRWESPIERIGTSMAVTTFSFDKLLSIVNALDAFHRHLDKIQEIEETIDSIDDKIANMEAGLEDVIRYAKLLMEIRGSLIDLQVHNIEDYREKLQAEHQPIYSSIVSLLESLEIAARGDNSE